MRIATCLVCCGIIYEELSRSDAKSSSGHDRRGLFDQGGNDRRKTSNHAGGVATSLLLDLCALPARTLKCLLPVLRLAVADFNMAFCCFLWFCTWKLECQLSCHDNRYYP